MKKPAFLKTPRAWRRSLLLLGVAAIASCSTPSREHAVPTAIADRATVLDNPAIRTWDDTFNPAFTEEFIRASKLEMELRQAAGESGPLPPAYYLAISGGGADGAYGAGIICGWTTMGTRPEFKVVTGISTGALTAPFVFLGPAYDERLRKVYTCLLYTSDAADE